MSATTTASRSTALITGATGGIGRHLVELCIADGMRVLAVGRDSQALQDLVAAVDSHALIPVHADLLAGDAIDIIEATCAHAAPTLQLLVNCAGRGLLSRFESECFDYQRDLCRLNFEVPARVTHALLPRLAQGAGQVLNIASLVGLLPASNMAMLSASKAALLNWSLALRAELSGRVGVTAFCPGVTRTPFLARARMGHLRLGESFIAHEPAHVARHALDAARRNRAIAYAGCLDRLAAVSTRLVPASTLARIAGKLLVPAS